LCGLELLQPAYTGNLLRKHTMQLGIDAVRLDRDRDERPHCLVDAIRGVSEAQCDGVRMSGQ
jgi:hypothetical protein